MERTLRWLQRCKVEHDRLNSLPDTVNPHQMLFGINQGATFADLRAWHMQEIAKIDCDGYAIGGLAVGEPAEIMYEMIDVVEPFAPKEKPRYLMGVGTPSNIIEAVARGVDFFDCVMPSRNGRHGKLFTWEGNVNIMNEKYITDDRPISESCSCPVCRCHSRAPPVQGGRGAGPASGGAAQPLVLQRTDGQDPGGTGQRHLCRLPGEIQRQSGKTGLIWNGFACCGR